MFCDNGTEFPIHNCYRVTYVITSPCEVFWCASAVTSRPSPGLVIACILSRHHVVGAGTGYSSLARRGCSPKLFLFPTAVPELIAPSQAKPNETTPQPGLRHTSRTKYTATGTLQGINTFPVSASVAEGGSSAFVAETSLLEYPVGSSWFLDMG